MKKLLAGWLCAAAAWASLGSIISSFSVGSFTVQPYPKAIFRDAANIYVLAYGNWSSETGWDYRLQRYDIHGVKVGEVPFNSKLSLEDMDQCHLGAGYMVVGGGDGYELYIMNKQTGSIVRTLYACGPGGGYPDLVAWDGRYYYVGYGSAAGRYRTYTSAGSFVANHQVPNWPASIPKHGGFAFAHRFKNKGGDYLIILPGYNYGNQGHTACAVNIPTGTIVATWPTPDRCCFGACVGDSSQPGPYGIAAWCLWEINTAGYALEVDLDARGGNALLPASLGCVKALYR